MCIRDRAVDAHVADAAAVRLDELLARHEHAARTAARVEHCLLYTSDAADERSSVDLGGRRIIKKKTQRTLQ